MSIWIVYQAADRLIVGVFGTAADAAAWVAAGTGLRATAGLTTAAALEAQPGQYYLADGTVAFDFPLTALAILKQTVWTAHAHLQHVWEQIQIEGAAHPWAELIRVHNYLAKIHPSLFAIVKTNVAMRSFVERTAFCASIPNGPQDGSGNVLSIGALFQAITNAADMGTQQGVVYVNPNAPYAHVSIADSLSTTKRYLWGLGATTGPAFAVTEQELASGDWINTIT